MKIKNVLLLCLVFFLVFCFFLLASNAKEEKVLAFGFSLNPMIRQTSFSGKDTADIRELVETMGADFEKNYGYMLTLKIYPAPKFLFKAFQDKTADVAASYLALYLAAKNKGMPVAPLLSFSTTGKKSAKWCLYAHKNSGLKNVKQLQGKRFLTDFPIFLSSKDSLPPKESYIYWIIFKKILIQSGVNKPFHDFLKEFKVLPIPAESVSYAVLLREFDVFLDAPANIQTLKNYDKGFSELVPMTCLDAPAGAPLIYRKDMPADIVEKLKNYLLPPQKGSQAEEILKKEFKGIRFFPASEKDYAVYFQWLKEAEKKGWIDEFDEIMKQTMKEMKEKKNKPKSF